jgi:uroporphyrinogen-III synthase
MRVLVTRREGAWPALVSRFAGTPLQLQLTPTTVQVPPVDPRPGDEAIGRLPSYDWLVLTSGSGVAALRRRLDDAGVAGLPPGLRVAAVGPATARALADLGARVDVVAVETTSDGLGSTLVPVVIPGSRVLLVRPEGVPGPMAAALQAAGATVDEAPLYRTIASPDAGALAEAAIAGAFAGVVFTAPSSAELWLDAAGASRDALVAALGRARRIAIGPTTEARLAILQLPAEVTAATATEAAIGDAIAQAFRL